MAAQVGGSPAALAALKQYWGFSAFRHAQAEVIDAVLAGRDSLCVMATGSGKSLWCVRVRARVWAGAELAGVDAARALGPCVARSYQIPPLVSNKVCLVVSPLISLMQDQARPAARRGAPAAALTRMRAPWRGTARRCWR